MEDASDFKLVPIVGNLMDHLPVTTVSSYPRFCHRQEQLRVASAHRTWKSTASALNNAQLTLKTVRRQRLTLRQNRITMSRQMKSVTQHLSVAPAS
jgi:hypothetical protein